MGGNVFKGQSKRLDADLYKPFSESVLVKLIQAFPTYIFLEPRYYQSKENFGDMDIVTNLSKEISTGKVAEVINATHWSHNGPCASFLVDSFQIDLIRFSSDIETYTAYWYYSYNDIGNLLGKIFHKFGLKYGHRGLTMPLRDGTHMFGEIIVSTELKDIFSFIGVDVTKYLTGFKDLEEIFKFVESSPYFNPAIYRYEVLNSENRVRDRKRATYKAFISRWADKLEGDWYQFKEDKNEYLPRIWEHFPTAKARYDEEVAKLRRKQEFKTKFNGKLVSDWTGLEDRELGKFIVSIEDRIDSEYVLSHSEYEIELKVKELYNDIYRI